MPYLQISDQCLRKVQVTETGWLFKVLKSLTHTNNYHILCYFTGQLVLAREYCWSKVLLPVCPCWWQLHRISKIHPTFALL